MAKYRYQHYGDQNIHRTSCTKTDGKTKQNKMCFTSIRKKQGNYGGQENDLLYVNTIATMENYFQLPGII